MTRYQKHRSGVYAYRIVRDVVRHPGNEGRQLRALVSAARFQLDKRGGRLPADRPVFARSRLICHRDSSVLSKTYYFGDHFEYDEMWFVQRYLRPGDGFIDGGANTGIFSILAAEMVGPTGRIDAFEPGTVAADRFEENRVLNRLDQVVLHREAVSAGPGHVSFKDGWDVANKILPAEGDTRAGTAHEVATVALDDVLPDGADYALGKLDLEGAEVLALQGAERHLAAGNPPVWITEGLDHQLRSLGSSREELFTVFRDHGYAFADYDARRNHLSLIVDEADVGQNFLAVRTDRLPDILARLRPLGA